MSDFITIPSDFLPHITYIGQSNTPNGWKHQRRRVSENICYFISSGDMYLTVEKTQYRLQKGDVFLIPAGREHVGFRSSTCSYYYVHFDDSCLNLIEHPSPEWIRRQIQDLLYHTSNESPLSGTLYTDFPLMLPAHFHIDDVSFYYSVTQKLETAIDYLNMKKPYYKTATSCCIMTIFQELSRVWIDSAFQDSHMNLSSSVYQKANALLEYLHTEYQHKLTGADIGAAFGMNFDYLNRIFKKRTGSTIFTYLNHLRLEHAKQLLTTTDLPLAEIASRTGFSDVYYFSRHFKQHCGLSPSTYRR